MLWSSTPQSCGPCPSSRVVFKSARLSWSLGGLVRLWCLSSRVSDSVGSERGPGSCSSKTFSSHVENDWASSFQSKIDKSLVYHHPTSSKLHASPPPHFWLVLVPASRGYSSLARTQASPFLLLSGPCETRDHSRSPQTLCASVHPSPARCLRHRSTLVLVLT